MKYVDDVFRQTELGDREEAPAYRKGTFTEEDGIPPNEKQEPAS